jgi:hypothetical protein
VSEFERAWGLTFLTVDTAQGTGAMTSGVGCTSCMVLEERACPAVVVISNLAGVGMGVPVHFVCGVMNVL